MEVKIGIDEATSDYFSYTFSALISVGIIIGVVIGGMVLSKIL